MRLTNLVQELLYLPLYRGVVYITSLNKRSLVIVQTSSCMTVSPLHGVSLCFFCIKKEPHNSEIPPREKTLLFPCTLNLKISNLYRSNGPVSK